ncbi:MAG: hypothetical protein H0X14_09720 [Acidobacteria bacterium]|nr:hypothetical protein [Acidobacteriota bacterium]
MEEANAFLPEFISDYNRRFSVTPRSAMDAHRPLDQNFDLDRILCTVEERCLSQQLTFSYKRTLYLVLTKRPPYTLRHQRVEVRESREGHLRVEYKGQRLEYQIITEQRRPAVATQSKQLNEQVREVKTKQRSRQRPPTHPWKRYSYSTMTARRPHSGEGHLYLGQTADISTLD